MTQNVRITGLRELERNLEQLGKRTGRSVMHRALRKAADPMLKAARANAPYDKGDLERSIKISTRAEGADAGQSEYRDTLRGGGSRSEAVAAMRSARRALQGSVTLYLGPTTQTTFYARFQEFGTAHHAPDPFMRPAFDAEARPTIERLKPILAAEIDRAVKRAAAKAARQRA